MVLWDTVTGKVLSRQALKEPALAIGVAANSKQISVTGPHNIVLFDLAHGPDGNYLLRKTAPKLPSLAMFVAMEVMQGRSAASPSLNGTYALTSDGTLVHVLHSGSSIHRSTSTGVRLIILCSCTFAIRIRLPVYSPKCCATGSVLLFDPWSSVPMLCRSSRPKRWRLEEAFWPLQGLLVQFASFVHAACRWTQPCRCQGARSRRPMRVQTRWRWR